MNHLKSILISCPLLISLLFTVSTDAAQFVITNNCLHTVWAAAVPGGGRELAHGQSWTISANPGQTGARIWARTGCTQTGPNGLRCATGDCGGLLRCTAYGSPPNTLAEYSLRQYNNLDFYDISLVDGFNVPMQFAPTSGCRVLTCNTDVVGQCPAALRANRGCNNPCTVFRTDQYCCNSGSCGPTDYSRYFKRMCPDAYSYPNDKSPTTPTSCPNGANYKVVFCP